MSHGVTVGMGSNADGNTAVKWKRDEQWCLVALMTACCSCICYSLGILTSVLKYSAGLRVYGWTVNFAVLDWKWTKTFLLTYSLIHYAPWRHSLGLICGDGVRMGTMFTGGSFSVTMQTSNSQPAPGSFMHYGSCEHKEYLVSHSATSREPRWFLQANLLFASLVGLLFCRWAGAAERSLMRCRRLGYLDDTDAVCVDELFQFADDKLVAKILHNSAHVLQPLIPDRPPTSYDLRPRSHDKLLLDNIS